MTSDFDLPPIGHTMKEALALIDQLGPTAAPRYPYNKLRHLLSKLMGTKALFFREQPALQLVRGREVAIQMPGKYEMPPSGELITSIQELGPREPRDVNSYGRCHLPGAPVFYAAFNDETVLAELRPESGSLVYLLYCEPLPDTSFKSVTVGDFDHVRRYGRSLVHPPESPALATLKSWLKEVRTEDAYVRLVVDAFLASLINRPCSGPHEYKATAALCGVLMDLDIDMPGLAEALYYPSVAFPGGVNIAITRKSYAEKLRPVGCKLVQVLNNFGFGVYQTRIVAVSMSIGPDGKIAWTGIPPAPEQLHIKI
ncbi:RES domain-containing protein [Pseudoxanthomonas mexicana]|uniref:RES domain-containing protein n=1 Tax=Pseudoxanthomonas mexicana TaxID=128785 RepID=UPI0028A5F5CF|nr:RES domain-containing protein [Pseudoxanthomonas mexicana]